MRFDRTKPVQLVLLGAGGTGGYLVPHLYRLVYTLERSVQIIIADGDLVEERNLVRQNFCAADLGQNKAHILAERYANAFGLEASYVPHFVTDGDSLSDLLCLERRGFLPILIGAVDNNRTRQICHELFCHAHDLIYIDAGNGEFSGQVVCGVRRGGRTQSRPVARYYPDILKSDDLFPNELSCAQASEASPQAITANITAATIVADMLYNILVLGKLETKWVTFSTKTINVRSYTMKNGGKRR